MQNILADISVKKNMRWEEKLFKCISVNPKDFAQKHGNITFPHKTNEKVLKYNFSSNHFFFFFTSHLFKYVITI